ncbi:MAG TPA: hypothetical protein VF503_07020 [Sphingobium sp.]|uniref:hypothetical protein n=1 Tax=Sphingobium sp. TaxID=1912891 RepID=UPI002ED1104A
MMMDAPSYLPTHAYQAPVIAPYRLSLGGCAVRELMDNPAAWAIVTRHLPMVGFMVGSPMVQAQLGNMSVIDFGTFSMPLKADVVEAVDRELAALGLVGKGQ